VQKVCISTGQNWDRKISDQHLLVYAQCMQWISVSLSTKYFQISWFFCLFAAVLIKKWSAIILFSTGIRLLWVKELAFQHAVTHFFRRLKKISRSFYMDC
jgi:hypothetical protein